MRIIILCCLILCFGCGQKEIIYYDFSQDIYKKGRIYKGKYVGRWTNYYKDGTVMSTTRLGVNSREKGKRKEFYEDGTIAEIYFFKRGSLIKTCSYHRNGKMAYLIESIKSGIFHGKYEFYYQNGNPKVIGKMDTMCSKYSKIGSTLKLDPSVNCFCKVGEWTEYYADGKTKARGFYQNVRIASLDSTNAINLEYPKVGEWIFIDSLSGDTTKQFYPIMRPE